MTTDPIGPCCDLQVLEQVAAGITIDEDVSAHLSACEKCQAVLGEIRGENDFLGEVLGANIDEIQGRLGMEHQVEGYEIIHEIHRGGQGIVYEAEQISTRRTVGIKMLLQGRFATSKQRQRFEREVEVIAGLQHPGIVTLYESGTARGGETYFAMEFVRGTTLDQWNRAIQPTIEGRIRLFAEVCDAVRYAHGRGIIHRDLKPGNILVDEENNPHVLDFGLARVADPEGGEPEGLATMAGEFLGTFAYAAPEQLEGDPTRIDVRTDVFALGILLYELLSGEHPFDMGDSLAALVQNRSDKPPVVPSVHDPGIDRDLDVICLKALSADPERRYGSAGELEEDLRRHLDRRPILARADSTAYVLGRVVRRHKLPFVAAILILLLSIGSAVGFAILATRAEAKQVLAEERLAALADFIGLFNFYTGQGKDDMRVSEAIELMDKKVLDQYQDQPEVASTILTAVGLIHLSFDNIDRAHEILEYVLDLRVDSNAKERGEAHHNLGRVWMDKGNYPMAFEEYQQAYELRKSALGDHPDLAMTLQHLGACTRKQGDFEASGRHFDEAERILLGLGLFDGERAARLLNSRAWLENARANEAIEQGDLPASRLLQEQALEMFRTAGLAIRGVAAPNDYRIGRSERSIGAQLARLERHQSAVERFDEAIRILSTKGTDSDELLSVLFDRARSRYQLGDDPAGLVGELEGIVAVRERNALERANPTSWSRLEETLRLLAEVQSRLGDTVERARNLERAEAARAEAERLQSEDS
jgi:tetratricopeptide (TPR) repeat protein/tRNA A-37 threonylcarbamoyl transferase component Bud32